MVLTSPGGDRGWVIDDISRAMGDRLGDILKLYHGDSEHS